MRLAFVTPEFVTEPTYAGGLANYLGRISVALAAAGHDVHVFTRSQQPGELRFGGVTVHRVVPLWDSRMILDHIDPWVPRRYYNVYQDVKAAWCLWRALRLEHARCPFDLVQISNVMAVGLFVPLCFSAPVVARMSSYRPQWDTLAGVEVTGAVRLRWALEKRSVAKRRFIYAPSQHVARQVQQNYRTVPVRVIESPFFIEQAGARTSATPTRKRPYALFFGRMTQMKGAHVLAQALPAVFGACDDLDIVCIGPDAKAPGGGSMHVLLQAAGAAPGRVRVHGSMRHDELYPMLRGAEFVVLPSLVDNLPNTLLESMGLGKVVVGTTGSCFEQLIEHGRSGFLVPPGDSGVLARQMIELHKLGRDARTDIEQRALQAVLRLHPDTTVPALERYFQEVLARHSGEERPVQA